MRSLGAACTGRLRAADAWVRVMPIRTGPIPSKRRPEASVKPGAVDAPVVTVVPGADGIELLVVGDNDPDVGFVDDEGDAEWSFFGQPETVIASTRPRRPRPFSVLSKIPTEPMDTMVLNPGPARNIADGEIPLTKR